MKNSVVTDHALVRYIDRIEGVDTENIRRYVLSCRKVRTTVHESRKHSGQYTVKHRDGFWVVATNGRVVTIFE